MRYNNRYHLKQTYSITVDKFPQIMHFVLFFHSFKHLSSYINKVTIKSIVLLVIYSAATLICHIHHYSDMGPTC